MFGNQQPPQGNAAQPAKTFASVGSFDRRPQRLPLGDGTYEILKAGTRKTPQNFDEFYCVLKCLEHSEAANKDRIFEFTKILQGLYLEAAYREIGQMLIFSFGPEAAKLPAQTIGNVLDQSLLADNWAKFNETQSIEGKTVVGNKVKVRGYVPTPKVDPATGLPKPPKLNPRTGKPFDAPLPRYVIDVA